MNVPFRLEGVIFCGETSLNDHLNAATTSLHCPETTVPTDRALKETVTGLVYGGYLSTADYSHYATPLLTNLHAMHSLEPGSPPSRDITLMLRVS